MKSKLLKIIALSLFAAMSLISCGDDNAGSEEQLENYEIVKGEALSDQKVYKTGLAFSSSAIEKIDLNLHKWHWSYGRNPIFFDSTCSFSKGLLASFADLYGYDTHFENESYSCRGTKFYSYNERFTDDPSEYMIEMPKESGIYVPFLVCDLIEYTITPKNGGESFKIYGSANEPYLTLIKVR